jgi:predicted anti-sigma-YlaC factor YlaD
MNCDACKKMMLDFLPENLQNIENKEFVSHLEDCPSCRNEFQSHRQCWDLLGEVETIEPDPNYISRFWTAVSEQETWFERLAGSWANFLRPKVLVPVLSCLVLAVMASWLLGIPAQKAVEDPLALSLNGFELEMAESLELVEHMDIIEEFDILLDFEIIEELDSLEA